VLRALARAGVRRGLLGGSRAWTVLGGAAVALRLWRRLTARDEKVVFRQELAPGESLLVSSQPPLVRRGR